MIASKCHKKGYEVVRSILPHLLSKVTHLRGTHQKNKKSEEQKELHTLKVAKKSQSVNHLKS